MTDWAALRAAHEFSAPRRGPQLQVATANPDGCQSSSINALRSGRGDRLVLLDAPTMRQNRMKVSRSQRLQPLQISSLSTRPLSRASSLRLPEPAPPQRSAQPARTAQPRQAPNQLPRTRSSSRSLRRPLLGRRVRCRRAGLLSATRSRARQPLPTWKRLRPTRANAHSRLHGSLRSHLNLDSTASAWPRSCERADALHASLCARPRPLRLVLSRLARAAPLQPGIPERQS